MRLKISGPKGIKGSTPFSSTLIITVKGGRELKYKGVIEIVIDEMFVYVYASLTSLNGSSVVHDMFWAEDVVSIEGAESE